MTFDEPFSFPCVIVVLSSVVSEDMISVMVPIDIASVTPKKFK